MGGWSAGEWGVSSKFMRIFQKIVVIFARVNVSSEEKILSISSRPINHLVAEASLDVEDTKRAKYPAQQVL